MAAARRKNIPKPDLNFTRSSIMLKELAILWSNAVL
jgi:hypothetical protein